MTAISRVLALVSAFVVNYCRQHRHPVNAVLHIAGVPMAFFGAYQIVFAREKVGWLLVVVGYLFQFIGHRAQGNEVGEVTLARRIWRRFSRSET